MHSYIYKHFQIHSYQCIFCSVYSTLNFSNQEESCMALLEAGADVNAHGNAATLLMFAALHGSFHLLKTIATHPQLIINAQV